MEPAKELRVDVPVKLTNPYNDYYGMVGTVVGMNEKTITVQLGTGKWINVNADAVEVVDDPVNYEEAWDMLKKKIKIKHAMAEQQYTNADPATTYHFTSLARASQLKNILDIMDDLV